MCAASSALKKLAARRISRRHSQNVLLPVQIPPVIPIAGIKKNLSRTLKIVESQAAECSEDAQLCDVGNARIMQGL